MKRFLAGLMVVAALLADAWSFPPAELDYQGKILVEDLPYTGAGYFKFAIANADSSQNFWANDGTSVGEPSGYLTNQVFNGVFSTLLGQAPMSPIDTTIFGVDTNLYLRVWFSTTASGFSEMLPAQPLASVPYALNAEQVGGLTASQIHDQSVATATNAITLAGDVTGLPQNNSLSLSVVFDGNVSPSANIDGTKIAQGSTAARGTLRLAIGSTGTAAIATGHPALNNYGVVNTLTAAAPNSALSVVGLGAVYVSNQAPNTVQIGLGALTLPPLPNIDNVIWVATNGTAAGPGTIEKPYDTPQNGYNAAVARYGLNPSVVLIAGGAYFSTLNMNAGTVHVIGLARPQLSGLSVSGSPSGSIKQRVENLIITGGNVTVAGGGANVKFYNVRMNMGLTIQGSGVEVQNCYIVSADALYPAVQVGSGEAIYDIGLYHSSLEQQNPANPTLLVQAGVQRFEVLWCEIANVVNGTAITDNEPGPITPVHLYAHNWIKGPAPAGAAWAVQDPNAGNAGATIGFYQNTVFGHVGLAGGNPPGHAQYFANNVVHGIINYLGVGTAGWQQAGAGSGLGAADAAQNTEFNESYPALPKAYRD